MHRKPPCRPKRWVTSRDALPRCLLSKLHLDWEMCVHTWEDPEVYQIWTLNQGNQNDWPKETQKKCPIKVVQTVRRAPLSDSLLESDRVSIHTLFSSLLINTLLVSLLSDFVEILCCKTKGPGTLSLTTLSRLGSSAFISLTQSSLCLGIQALLQAVASQVHLRSQSGIYACNQLCLSGGVLVSVKQLKDVHLIVYIHWEGIRSADSVLSIIQPVFKLLLLFLLDCSSFVSTSSQISNH